MTETSKEGSAALLQSGHPNNEVEPQNQYYVCNCSSNSTANIQESSQTDTEEEPFACLLCIYRRSQSSSLNTRKVKDTVKKHYNCDFCTKPFTSSKAYKIRHEKFCKLNPKQNDPSWVQVQRPFKCQVCPFSTDTKADLNRHVVTHTGEKPFPCSLCNQKFSFRSNLQKHKLTHIQEKPHVCQFCTKGFADVGNQKKHEKICKLNPKQGDAKWVEEQKKFKCHFCTYRAARKEHLENHLRSHIGEKPLLCPLCFYNGTQTSSLHYHLRHEHIKENGYKCHECEFTTFSSSEVLNHVNNAHVET